MAAGMRSDCRIARARARMRTCGPERVPKDRAMLPTLRKAGCVDLHLSSTREGRIAVALTSRGRRQLQRLRGMSTRIRALVHEHEVDASTVTFW
jgi:hypothetical protein